jgi:hypothetical protein
MNKPSGITALVVTLLATLGVSTASASTRPAQSGHVASCQASDFDITLAPGVGMVYEHGTITSHGQIGKIACRGFVKGHEVTGPGTFGEEGVIEGDCSGGEGSSTLSFTLPTTGGTARLSIPVTFTYKPGWGWKSADAFMGPLVFHYYPLKGDCLTEPITEVRAAIHTLIRS